VYRMCTTVFPELEAFLSQAIPDTRPNSQPVHTGGAQAARSAIVALIFRAYPNASSGYPGTSRGSWKLRGVGSLELSRRPLRHGPFDPRKRRGLVHKTVIVGEALTAQASTQMPRTIAAARYLQPPPAWEQRLIVGRL
jgi:hypothetical protein